MGGRRGRGVSESTREIYRQDRESMLNEYGGGETIGPLHIRHEQSTSMVAITQSGTGLATLYKTVLDCNYEFLLASI